MQPVYPALMRCCLSLAVLLVSLSVGSAADTYRIMNSDEAKALSIQAKKYLRSIEVGDAETFLRKTHPAIFRAGGTRDDWEKGIRQNLKTLAMVTRVERFQWGAISPVYLSDTDEVCFITKTSVVQVADKRHHVVDYLIAARDVGTTEWFFLTGGGTGENPQLMWVYFRDLPKDLKLPPFKVTRLQ